jgi:SAM-dependent methyltransferase
MDRARLEITDVIVDYDPETLARRPVRKADAIARLRASGGSALACELVADMPDADGILDEAAVDRLILRAHTEMQRLWEMLLHGRRVAALVGAIVAALERRGTAPIRVVDVGCGAGYVVRWLAAHQAFGPDVELIGADYNAALVAAANELAELEGLKCRFVVANAFRMQETASVYMSTGVLHHFAGDGLDTFFRAQAERRPAAFVHFDVQNSWAAPIGAWLFHKAKFRERVGQHDGIVSALRAHDADDLARVARAAAPGYRIIQFNRPLRWMPVVRTMNAVIAVEPELVDPFLEAAAPMRRELNIVAERA